MGRSYKEFDMRIARLICIGALAAFAGGAQASKTGAGPAAGSGIIGSTVVPGSDAVLGTPEKDHDGRRLRPGDAGVLILTGEQLTSVRNALTASEGVAMTGSVIRVPTVLADGAAATVILDTQTGQLMVVRN